MRSLHYSGLIHTRGTRTGQLIKVLRLIKGFQVQT